MGASAVVDQRPSEFRELAPPKMFPRTEGQAKATCIVLLLLIFAAIAYLVFHGVDLRNLARE